MKSFLDYICESTEKQTATVVLFAPKDYVLLGKKGKRWVLPGGRKKEDESLKDAARREFREETGLHINEPLRYIGSVKSHHCFAAIGKRLAPRAGDDLDHAEWVSLQKLPDLAFGHKEWVNLAREKLEF